uniref:Proteasome activator PA28 C-terminal domain-containing protein n=1 Tax=Catagonus wagneri TaxID=51154 RepID=A0A8C3W153_9CETA
MASPLKLEQDLKGKVDSFRARIAQEAEDLVSIFFPQKLSELASQLLREKCNTVRMWVQLFIPKVEDGNNFGVSIQEDMVDQLWTAESTAASYLGRFSTYYNTRAKLVSKIVKYPQVEDYCRTVAEVDENEYLSVPTVHDVILRNIQKIKTPGNTNTGDLY